MTSLQNLTNNYVQSITSNSELTLLTAQCMIFLTASKAKQSELKEQGHIKRFFKDISRKNKILANSFSEDLVNAQLASQQILKKLANRHVLTLDIIYAIQQKMHILQKQNDSNFEQLIQLIDQTYEHSNAQFNNLNNRLIATEKRTNIINWYLTNSLKKKNIDSPILVILTIVEEFYTITNGEWDDLDLYYIELLLQDLNLSYEIPYSILSKEKKQIDSLFLLVPPLSKENFLYLSENMNKLYSKREIEDSSSTPIIQLIHELLNTLVLIKMLTPSFQINYAVILHELKNPNRRIHIIRTLYLQAQISKEKSQEFTWATTPVSIKTYDSYEEAQILKEALEQNQCIVTIEEVPLSL